MDPILNDPGRSPGERRFEQPPPAAPEFPAEKTGAIKAARHAAMTGSYQGLFPPPPQLLLQTSGRIRKQKH